MAEPEITVIVCCYNSSIDKLKKTIVSIEKQKDVSFNVIISDDGSKINHKEEIMNWSLSKSFKNIIYNFLPKNCGTVSNIISALKLATTKFVKTISPGDFLFDEFSLYKYVTQFRKSNADIVYCKGRYFTPEGKIVNLKNPLSPITSSKLFMKRNICLYGDFILGASIAAKTNVELYYLNKIQGKVKLLEDVPLTCLALLDKRKISFCKSYLVWYEYGLGISTKGDKPNPILSNDFDSFYNYLDENSNARFVKRIVKFQIIDKSSNRWIRFFKRCLISPMYLLFKLSTLFSHTHKPTKKEYNQLSSITEGWE